MKEISSDILNSFKARLEDHPVYEAVQSIEDLRCFMQHHVYSVWDYMSLIKYLQAEIAPTQFPWVPKGDASVRRFVNELVMEEESDESVVHGEFSSHYELYLVAMREIGAETSQSEKFVQMVINEGIDKALQSPFIPAPSQKFTSNTFASLLNNKPHEVAACLALGREHIIPSMFHSLLSKMNVSKQEAPIFHYYLQRHIDLDGDSHAPLSLRLLNGLCHGDEEKIEEAVIAANNAVKSRLKFWDGVLDAIQNPAKELATVN
ncbi:MAG: DUF3050 domain-containing protein [Lentisphaeraceae bacterium]|nr:DUF3050 domain-containing protein [Lentisphaeraceae bacterium]